MKREPYIIQEKELPDKILIETIFNRKLLKDNNVIQSMSRKGTCIDNASKESFLAF